MPPPLSGEALAVRTVSFPANTKQFHRKRNLFAKGSPGRKDSPGRGRWHASAERGTAVEQRETERARLFPKSKETQRSKLCLSESVYRCVFLFPLSDSPSQALTRQLFPFLALPFSPDRGKSFPKGEPLAKRGNCFCILCTVLPLQFVKMRQIL